MPVYAPLFRLNVVHDYFADPAALALDFRPDPQTADWLERTGSVLKAQANSLSVFYDTEGRGGGPPTAAGQPATLKFDATADDPLFAEYTEGPPSLRPPLFSGVGAQRDDAGVWVLKTSDSQGLAARAATISFRIELPISADLAEAGRRYRVAFGSRAVGWKYVLLDDWNGVTPMVVDTAPKGAVVFGEPVAETLADGRQALAIVSKVPIALSEQPPQRFQLCAANGDGAPGRVLIASLPAAAPGRLGLHRPPKQQPVIVSEIYVAR